MNFETHEDQKMVRETVRRYAADSLAAQAEEWDEEQQLPRDVFSELRDLGLLGLTLPAEFGGSGLDEVAALLSVEELARHDASTALSVVTHSVLVGELCQALGCHDVVASLASGEKLGTFSMATEVPAQIELDDGRRIEGRAPDLVQCRNADLAVIFARDGDERRVVLLVDADDVAVERVPNDGPLGCRAADLGTWVLNGAGRTPDAVLSDRSAYSEELLADHLGRGRSYLGAIAVGVARGALEEGLAYAKDREQFGRPISRFQATQFKLADMSTRVDAARLAVLRGAISGSSGGRRGRAATLAFDVALDVADEAVQLHGGYGYTSEYPVERFLRDARSLAAMLGGRRTRTTVSSAELASDTPFFA